MCIQQKRSPKQLRFRVQRYNNKMKYANFQLDIFKSQLAENQRHAFIPL